jgi:cytoskeleton protein RodZ
MERFCDELRWEREQRDVSVETICAETKVSPKHVEALESGDFGELPGGVFRKGILRSYLKVLGLDEAPWMARFEASLIAGGFTDSAGSDWTEFAENVRRMRVSTRPHTERRWLGVAGMFVLLALCGWLVWTLVVRPRVEIMRPGADVGAFQRSSGSGNSPGNR